jgi:hypothetical protein
MQVVQELLPPWLDLRETRRECRASCSGTPAPSAETCQSNTEQSFLLTSTSKFF